MFKKIEGSFEKNSGVKHPDYESRNTRVSEYLRKYGQGKMEKIPTDTRPQVNDPRTVDEMLDDNNFEPSMATDDLDVMLELDSMKDRYNDAVEEINLTKSQKLKFDNAVKVLKDQNSSNDARLDAYRILDELEKQGKISRARD